MFAVMTAYEFTLSELLIMASLVLLAGGLIGFLIASIRRGCGDDRKIVTLEQEVQELRQYKSDVSEHFRETASQLQTLTGQYRSIYEHMAHGAQTLCDDESGEEVLRRLHSGLLNDPPLVQAEKPEMESLENQDLDKEDRST